MLDIFKTIHIEKEISRVELVDKTCYSPGTISNHVTTLLDKELILEQKKGISQGGRKPIYLKVNAHKHFILAVKIEVKKVSLYLLDLDLNVVELVEKQDNKPISYENCLNFLSTNISQMLAKRKDIKDKILGLGISVPAIINREEGLIEIAPNLKWYKKSILQDLKNKYDFPFYLENDAKAGALGEKNRTKGDTNNFVYVLINEGIGCGIVINGELYRGSNDNAGEFGHVKIDPQGPNCHCGNSGCWETLASVNYLVNAWEKHTGEQSNIQNIYKLAVKGKKEACSLFGKLGENIGAGIVSIINGLSPGKIIINGKIVQAKTFIDKSITKKAKEESLQVAYDNVKIEYSKLLDKAEVIGIGYSIIERSRLFQ